MLRSTTQDNFSALVLYGSTENFESYVKGIDNTPVDEEHIARPLDNLLAEFLIVLNQKQPKLRDYTAILQKLSILFDHGARMNAHHHDEQSTRNYKEIYEIAKLKDKNLTYAIMGLFVQRGFDPFKNHSDVTCLDQLVYHSKMPGLAGILSTLYPKLEQGVIPKNQLNTNHPLATDRGGNSYLHDAVLLNQSYAEIQNLVFKGFSVTQVNKDGINPLELAKYFTPNNHKVIDFLTKEYIKSTRYNRILGWGLTIFAGIASYFVGLPLLAIPLMSVGLYFEINRLIKSRIIKTPIMNWKPTDKAQYEIDLENETLTFDHLEKTISQNDKSKKLLEEITLLLNSAPVRKFNEHDMAIDGNPQQDFYDRLKWVNNKLSRLNRKAERPEIFDRKRSLEKLTDHILTKTQKAKISKFSL